MQCQLSQHSRNTTHAAQDKNQEQCISSSSIYASQIQATCNASCLSAPCTQRMSHKIGTEKIAYVAVASLTRKAMQHAMPAVSKLNMYSTHGTQGDDMCQASASVVAASLWTAACRQPAATQESASSCTILIFTTTMYQSQPCHPSCLPYSPCCL